MTRRAESLPSRVALVLVGGLLLAGCTTSGDPTVPPDPPTQAAPPDPPAACLLDDATLTATTGVVWTPDQSSASDVRCVYDAPGDPGPAAFLAVDVEASDTDPASLDTVAELCEEGSRAPVADGFVCRFAGRQVYGALLRNGQLVTVSTSAVPPGSTAARLAVAVTEQLRRLGT